MFRISIQFILVTLSVRPVPRLITRTETLSCVTLTTWLNSLLTMTGDMFVAGLLSTSSPGRATSVWLMVIRRCRLFDSLFVPRWCPLVMVGNRLQIRVTAVRKLLPWTQVFTLRPLLIATAGKIPVIRGMNFTLVCMWLRGPSVETLRLLSWMSFLCRASTLKTVPTVADPFVLPGLMTMVTRFPLMVSA